MDNSAVYIIGCSDVGEKVCAASGRISTQSGTALEIMEKSQDAEKNAKLISKVTASGHTSTVEHIFFNLAFENVSVVVEQFMIEFRLASFTVKSRRYVDFSQSGYYMPSFKSEEDKDIFTKHIQSLFALYGELCENGVAKEDARFVLPYCFYSNFYCSLGGRELINVLRAMLYGRGSKIEEIHTLGLSLLKQCQEVAPGVFTDFEKRNEKYNDEIDLSFINAETSNDEHASVELLNLSDNADKAVARAALIEKLGLSSKKIEEILQDETVTQKVVDSVLSCDRPRALESVNATIRFNDVSLSTLTHFARHRVQSISIPSLCDTNRENYIIPPCLFENKEMMDKYVEAFERNAALYKEFQEKGYTDSACVYLLLSGNTLDITTTMNARELLLFMKLRSCNRAQWEIRSLAIELLKQLRHACPILFGKYGPSCYCSFCPEGKLTCGKAKEIKEYFSAL